MRKAGHEVSGPSVLQKMHGIVLGSAGVRGLAVYLKHLVSDCEGSRSANGSTTQARAADF